MGKNNLNSIHNLYRYIRNWVCHVKHEAPCTHTAHFLPISVLYVATHTHTPMIRCLSRMCALYDNPSSPLPTHVQGDKPENPILFLLSGRLSYSPAFSSTVKLAAAPAVPGAAGREGGTILANKNSAPIHIRHGYVPEERKGKEEREVPEISLPEKGRRRTNVGQPETGGEGGRRTIKRSLS